MILISTVDRSLPSFPAGASNLGPRNDLATKLVRRTAILS